VITLAPRLHSCSGTLRLRGSPSCPASMLLEAMVLVRAVAALGAVAVLAGMAPDLSGGWRRTVAGWVHDPSAPPPPPRAEVQAPPPPPRAEVQAKARPATGPSPADAVIEKLALQLGTVAVRRHEEGRGAAGTAGAEPNHVKKIKKTPATLPLAAPLPVGLVRGTGASSSASASAPSSASAPGASSSSAAPLQVSGEGRPEKEDTAGRLNASTYQSVATRLQSLSDWDRASDGCRYPIRLVVHPWSPSFELAHRSSSCQPARLARAAHIMTQSSRAQPRPPAARRTSA
jgi:hypothetical protein